MTSLSQLNQSAASPIEITDARPATAILDRYATRDFSFTITNLNKVLVPQMGINEIVNYSTANVRYRLTIRSTSEAFINGSTLTFFAMPDGASLATSRTTYARVYTVSGLRSAAGFNQIKSPTWNIPNDFALSGTFWVESEIIYYDQALARDVTYSWASYDDRYYYFAVLRSASSITGAGGYRKFATAAFTGSFEFETNAPFTNFRMAATARAFVTANGRKLRILQSNMGSPAATFTAQGRYYRAGDQLHPLTSTSTVVCRAGEIVRLINRADFFVVAGRTGPGGATFIEGNGFGYGTGLGEWPQGFPGIVRIKTSAIPTLTTTSSVTCIGADARLVSAMVMSAGTMTVEGTNFKGTFVYPTATFTQTVSSLVLYEGMGALTSTSQVNVSIINRNRNASAAVQALSSMSCAGQVLRYSVFAWGDNTYGQLGLGDTTQRTSPTELINTKNWYIVSTGGNHTLAITSNGELWAWGDNTYGQVGDGTTTIRNSPVQIGIGITWSQVSAGARHSLALATNGDLYSWGDNSTGQLGLGDTTQRTSPNQVGSNAWRDISAGGSHSMARLLSNSSLYAWGDNTYGQLGYSLAQIASPRTTPLQVRDSTSWVRMSAGGTHSLGIKVVSGIQVIYAWGNNANGQLGLGDTTQRTIPTQITSSLSWSTFSAGENYSLARTIDDGSALGSKMFGWGDNTYGQLGLGDTTQRTSPTQISTLRIIAVFAGSTHALGITFDNAKLYAWGNNANGRTGLATTSGNTLTPTEVSLNHQAVATVGIGIATDAGGNHSVGVQFKIT
jgi:alpha-tubulin suppressor-like RCC1 family protein